MKNNKAQRKVFKPGLVLSRLVGESVVIFVGPDEIEVTVENVDRLQGKVSLRIVAPKKFDVFRNELLEDQDDDTGLGNDKKDLGKFEDRYP